MEGGPWPRRGAGEVGPDVRTAAGHPERRVRLGAGTWGPMANFWLKVGQ